MVGNGDVIIIILNILNNFHDQSIELSTDIVEKDKNEEKTGF